MPHESRPGSRLLLLAALGVGLAGCGADGGPAYYGGYGGYGGFGGGYYGSGYYARPPAYGYGFRPGYGGYYGSRPPGYVAPPPRYHGSPRFSGPPPGHARPSGPPPGAGHGPPPSRGGMRTIPELMREGNRR